MNRRTFVQSAVMAAAGAPALLAAGAPERIAPAEGGMLSIGGRRQFIHGLYQVPRREGALRAAAEAGFNLVSRPATREAYDEIHALGMRGWSSLGSIPPEKSEDAQKKMRERIEALRDHPALLFWETEDEPTYVWGKPGEVRVSAEQINRTAEFIRSIDPAHPLYLNHSPTNLVETLQAYNPGSEIVATDIYPVIPHGIRPGYALWPNGRQGDFLNATISQVGDYADKMRQVAGPDRAVIMVLQAFAWELLREKDQDPAMILFPTIEQLRFMAWQSVIHGANGIIWWGLAYEPKDGALWHQLREVIREMADAGEALAAPAAKHPVALEYHDTGHSLDRGIEWTLRQERGALFLAAVNADCNPVEVTFSGFGEGAKCAAYLGKAPVSREDGKLQASFEPFGTRVWRIVRSMTGD